MANELNTIYSHQTLKIGQALKWRGQYDDSLSYYRDNVVTMCSCVFWCRQLFSRNVPPLVYRSSDKSYQFANTETWICLVDNLWIYNHSSELVRISNEWKESYADIQTLINKANAALNAYDDYIIDVVHNELNKLRVGALDLQLHSTEGIAFRKGYVDTIIYAKILCNGFDVTDICTDLVHSYEWTRDTKNPTEDKAWAKSAEVVSNGLGVRIVDDKENRHDLGSEFFTEKRKAKFTLSVKVAIDEAGLTTEAQKTLNII